MVAPKINLLVDNAVSTKTKSARATKTRRNFRSLFVQCPTKHLGQDTQHDQTWEKENATSYQKLIKYDRT